MTVWSDGDIAWVVTLGTELEHFSQKGQRYVLLAYHDDADAFVYPISTRRPAKGPAWRATEHGFLVTERGLFRLPLSALQGNGERISMPPALRDRIRQDLQKREVQFLAQPGTALSQRPFLGLPKPPDEPTEPAVESKKPAVSDRELFEQYMRREVDSDVKRRANTDRES